jgi:hypothetical protein
VSDPVRAGAEIQGLLDLRNGLLTLAQDKGPVLAGRVSWKDATHETFRIVGNDHDSGVSFLR